MPITLQCSCGKQFKVLDDLAGKRVKCPGCQAIVAVPGGAEEEQAQSDEEGDAQPPKKKKKERPQGKSRAALWIGLGCGTIVLGFCCIGLGGGGFYWLVLHKTPEKTMIGRWQMDVQEHLKKDPRFLLLGAAPTVEFRSDGSVTMTQQGPTINGRWKHIKTDGDTVTLEIDGQRATLKVVDSDHIHFDAPWFGPSLYLKRRPGS